MKLTRVAPIYGFLVALICRQAYAELVCLNDNGKPVDWIIAYKLPRSASIVEPYDTGMGYVYITSETALDGSSKSGWRSSSIPLTDPSSFVMRTLRKAHDRKFDSKVSHLYYSDQPPSGGDERSTCAHAKGILMTENDTLDTIWLRHSVPRFPSLRDSPLGFEPNSAIFAQIFMCASISGEKNLKSIAEHLVSLRVNVYDYVLDKKLSLRIPDLESAAKFAKPKQKSKADIIQTRGGEKLTLFAKSSTFRGDIYSQWINNVLDSSLNVATWRSGVGGKLESACPPDGHHVNNVNEFKMTTDELGYVEWTFRQDHSKWAISDDADKGIVCLSDINRMVSQFKRGGGAVCIQCPSCWSAFDGSIGEVEPCPIDNY